MMSQGWRQRTLLLNQWEAQDRTLRLGRGQQTWETVEGTSGPLQVLEEQKLLQKAYCWAKIKSWHLSKGAVPWGTCGKGLH